MSFSAEDWDFGNDSESEVQLFLLRIDGEVSPVHRCIPDSSLWKPMILGIA